MQPNHRSRHLIALRCGVLCLAAVLIGSVLAPSLAQARRRSSKQTVLILRVEGSAVDDAVRRSLSKALARKARKYRHYRVVVSKTDLVEEMFEFECTEAGVECLSKIGGKYKADLIIYSEVAKGEGDKHVWSMRVVQMKSKDSPISRVAQSTVQTLEAVNKPKKSAANGLLVLIGPVDLPEKRTIMPGTLHVRLIGGGVALVYINEKLAGRSSLSGLKVQLQPGKYTLKVVRAGYKDWSQVVRVESGKTLDRIIELVALPQVRTPVGQIRPTSTSITGKWWFWTGLVTAAVATGVAIYFVTQQDAVPELGNAAFSLDSNDAHLDPVFGGG